MRQSLFPRIPVPCTSPSRSWRRVVGGSLALPFFVGCYVVEIPATPDDDDATDAAMVDDDDSAPEPDDDDSAWPIGDDDDATEAVDDDDTVASDDDDSTPPPVECPTWTFDGDVGGWTLGSDVALAAAQTPGSATLVSSGDAFLWTAAAADLSACTRVEAVFSVTGEDSTWEIFWERTGDVGFSPDRRHSFESFVDGTLNRYVFDLTDHPEWTGDLSRLRLDPRTGDGTVSLQSLSLTAPTGPIAPPLDLANVHWLHADVSGWPVTADLYTLALFETTICLEHDHMSAWPTVDLDGLGTEVNANPWIFVWKPDLSGPGGTWYGATWEWVRPNVPCKWREAVSGSHIKQAPFHADSGWAPSPGETVYFMMSGLARSWERNAEERTQLVPLVWSAP